MQKVSKVVSARLNQENLEKLDYMRRELEEMDKNIDRPQLRERTDSDMIKYAIGIAYDYCKNNPL